MSEFCTPTEEVKQWMLSSDNSFAKSLASYYKQRGYLSPKQLAAAEQNLKSFKPTAAKPTVAVDLLMQAFLHATEKGMKKPILRFNGFEASLAKPNSANPGAVYLKSGETYLGKIVNGILHPRNECTDAHLVAVQEAMKNPLEAAVKYGRETGRCSVCGRRLTDPESVANGIGPICEGLMGF